MKLKIKVTKEILERSKICGPGLNKVGENCAIALAVRDIFPLAYVDSRKIHVAGFCNNFELIIWLPQEAIYFIDEFDGLTSDERVLMPELIFEVTLNSFVLNSINIEEAKKAIEQSKTLELV